MKLSQLNESVRKNDLELTVYFDNKSKSFKLADNKTPKNNTHKVKKENFTDLGKKYKTNVTTKDWDILAYPNDKKHKKIKDPKFIRALEAMEADILRKSDTKSYKGI